MQRCANLTTTSHAGGISQVQPEIFNITTGLKQKIPRPVHSSEPLFFLVLRTSWCCRTCRSIMGKLSKPESWGTDRQDFQSSLQSAQLVKNSAPLSLPEKSHLTLSPQNYLARRRSSQGRGKFITDLLRQRLAGVSEGLQSVCFVAGLWLPICHFQLRV